MTAINETDANPLKGLRVLVVEDETLVAMLVEDYLVELECVVAASARRVAKAIDALNTVQIDAAILDLNVAGEDITPIISGLKARNLPFIFASGYGSKGVSPQWADTPILQKPFDLKQLKAALSAALSSAPNS